MPRSSSSRRANKWQRPQRELGAAVSALRRTAVEPDGTWVIQQVRGSASGKVYTCPGCHQELAAATPHTVAWRSDDDFGYGTGVTGRRHWHTACFNARTRRM
ncbi:hypothetical protein [Brevibacterium rongguiense]|uniref:hypothetical protein n=1 Tax=Brevibacterium rongguiense TaxID=2695267 RepID=UPI001F336D2C|nr:hypothetical protein [Brevibacterium rongguiense]